MINLMQNIGTELIDNIKVDNRAISIAKEEIDYKAELICSRYNDELEANIKDEYRRLAKVITELKEKAGETEEIKLKWSKDKGYLNSSPISLEDGRLTGIKITDCIQEIGKKLVRIRVPDIKNIIALEYIAKDIGYTHKEIEESLSSIGIASIYSMKEFREAFKDIDNMYNLSKDIVIEHSSYKDDDKKVIYGYFGNTEYRVDSLARSKRLIKGNKRGNKGKPTYFEVVSDTCRVGMSIILGNIVEWNKRLNGKIMLVSISEDEIVMLLDKNINSDKLVDGVCIRTFGRNIELDVSVEEE